jgi:hypothetical protein
MESERERESESEGEAKREGVETLCEYATKPANVW